MARSNNTDSLFTQLSKLMQLEKRDIYLVALLTIGSGLLALVIPLAVQTLVNIVTMGGASQPLLVVSIVLFCLLTLSGALYILEYYVVELIQRRIFVRNVLSATEKVVNMQFSTNDKQNTLELMNRFFDVATVQKTSYQLLTKGLAAALQTFIGCIVLMFYSAYFAIIAIFLLFFAWLIVRVVGRGAVETAIAESYAKYNVVAWLESMVQNLNLFKFSQPTHFVSQHSDALATDYLQKRQQHFSTILKQNIFAAFIYALIGTVMLGLGGWLVMQGDINLGQFVAAELIIFGVLAAFVTFISKLEYFYDLLAGLDKLSSLHDLPAEVSGAQVFDSSQAIKVQLRNVRYAFAAEAALNETSFICLPGAHTAVLSKSGSGKSILAQLIVGLRQPTAGLVELNDIDMRLLEKQSHRQYIAYVNDIELVEDSILNNITIGQIKPDLAAIQYLLNGFEMAKMIQQLPNGLNTRLTNTGAPLSTEATHLLMLTRALSRKPKLLVVDGLIDLLSDTAQRNVCNTLNALTDCTVIVMTKDAQIAAHFAQNEQLN